MHPRHKQITESIVNGNYPLAEQMAKALVKEYPIDGQGWLLLGETLMKQGFGSSAQLLFNRALLLDPKAKWMPQMKKLLAETPFGEARKDIEQLLAVPQVILSAAIIVKDEERSIERCIRSIENAVDQIVVVDSGSTDQTLSILQSFPNVEVVQVAWQDSFAHLRNEALKHVTSEWVLWLDADEWLDEEDRETVRTAAGIFHAMRGLIPALQPCLLNYVQGKSPFAEYSVPRLFPATKGIYYSGRIHEQLATGEEGIFTTNILYKPIGVRLHHDGYEPHIKATKNKVERNMKLLEKMTVEDPTNPGWWYFLGREALNVKGYEQSLECFKKAINYGRPIKNFGRMAEIHMLVGKIYSATNRPSLAEESYLKALEVHPDYPDAHFHLAQLAVSRAKTLLMKAAEHTKKAEAGFHTYRGPVAPDQDIYNWKAALLKSDIFVHTGRLADAKKVLRPLNDKFSNLPLLAKRMEYLEQQRLHLNLLNFPKTK